MVKDTVFKTLIIVVYLCLDLLQYGRKDDDKAASTPLVEHAPEQPPAGAEKGKKGKKGEKKDKLDDLKQELEMVTWMI